MKISQNRGITVARSNYYLLLGLPYDPPEERIEEITRSIEKKQHEWSRGAMDFRKGPVFREYMALLPDIKRVMSDTNLRKKEAEEAANLTRKKIENHLLIVAKRGFLYEAEIKLIADKCQVSTEMVEKVCQVSIRKEDREQSLSTKPAEYDHFQVFLVYLEALQKKDYYDYLRKDKIYDRVRRLSTRELLGLANKMDREKGKYTSTESANEKLCAECKRTFASEEGRKAYDEYLQWKSIQAVYEQIEVATRFTKVLEKGQREEAIRLLVEACGNKDIAEKLLKAYMEREHISYQGEETNLPIEHRYVPTTKKSKDRHKPSQEPISRANSLYPKVVKIREAMSRLHYEEAEKLLQEAIRQCGDVPELMRIQDQLTVQNKRLSTLLDKVKEEAEKKRFYAANLEFIQLKREFPQYSNPLMETKINHGLVSGKNFLTQAENTRQEEEIINACMDALAVCSDYPGVMELLGKYPPKLYGTITVSVDSTRHCNYVHWNDNKKEAYVNYCVIRKKDARPYHRQDGYVLGTVEGNSFVDQSIVPGEKYYYAVYAVRCGIYSNGLISRSGIANYCEVERPSICLKKGGVEITWAKVPTGAKVEVYRAKGYVPAHPSEGELLFNVTANGYVDREITAGNIYGYRVYTVYVANGEKHYSEGVGLRTNAGIENFEPATKVTDKREKIRVQYYFEVKKFLWHTYQVLLHIQPERYIHSLPPLLIVGGVTHAPLYRTSGKVIAMIPSKEVKEELVYTLSYKEIGELQFLNLFLQREEDCNEVMLSLGAGKTLYIGKYQ